MPIQEAAARRVVVQPDSVRQGVAAQKDTLHVLPIKIRQQNLAADSAQFRKLMAGDTLVAEPDLGRIEEQKQGKSWLIWGFAMFMAFVLFGGAGNRVGR